MPARMSGAESHTCVRLRSASEPIIQNTISTEANGFCDRLSASEISAVAMLETASPARISVTGPPCAPASATTASMATAAPASPPSGSASAKRRRQAQMDRQHRAERRAARDADQARLGQRIAQIALQRRARQPERAADQRAQHGARQADLAEDQRAGLAGGVDAEARRADRQRQQERGDRRRRQRRRADCSGLPSRRPEAPSSRRAPRCRPRAAASRSIASAMCGVPHSHMRHGSSREAPRWRSRPNDRMAQVVGERRAVLLGVARQHQQVRRACQQRLQRHLAAARSSG